ncbi:uncharacterized protein LOC123943488 isoform X1 [Meles meles]|uniref:uncharacterized protein LOC123943487 isoform X1 n=1 Tax=Meles meles TaxID=9662 RepID=UPI001E699564|nr:uncharacterized protein LOC123943487 isoform X1 [Meles meles]XP_045863746.1 uncharacterized protein LOC123943488 isoform X1 [Meles meles]
MPRASSGRAGRPCGGRLRQVWCPRGDPQACSKTCKGRSGWPGQAWTGGLGQTEPSPTSLPPQGRRSLPVLPHPWHWVRCCVGGGGERPVLGRAHGSERNHRAGGAPPCSQLPPRAQARCGQSVQPAHGGACRPGLPGSPDHAGGPLLILPRPRGWGRRAQPVSALCAEDTGAAVRRLLLGPVGSPAALGVLRSWRTMISSPPGSHRGSGALSSRVRADPALLLSGAVALPCLQHHPGSSPLCPRAGLAAPPGSHCALSL